MATPVLLTRPEGENEEIATRLRQSGLKVILRPLLELSERPATSEDKTKAMNIDLQDAVIFVSKSAVRFAIPLLESYWPQWPVAPAWFAVGSGTAAALSTFDIGALYPEVAGSEGLLDLPQFADVFGKKVLIVRGVGGRQLLAEELVRRGASVAYWEVYERKQLTYENWMDLPAQSIVVATSVEALESLAHQLGDQVRDLRLVVVSKRIADKADGFASVTIAGGASDQVLYDAIVELSQ